jgi:hypothetical protein
MTNQSLAVQDQDHLTSPGGAKEKKEKKTSLSKVWGTLIGDPEKIARTLE